MSSLRGGGNSNHNPPYATPTVCSPEHRKIYKSGANTCYDKESLVKLANLWNAANPNQTIPHTTNKSQLWHSLKTRVKECKNEWCWLEQPFAEKLRNDPAYRKTFKPPIPKGKYQWLATDDIEFVCDQYEPIVPSFKFLGAYPIDFTRVYYYIFGKFSVKDYLQQGYSKIGIVFNEDPHDQPGSHWVGLFLNLNKRIAYFFDSYGEVPHKRIRLWVDSLRPKFRLVHNRTRYQYENSECGMYTIHFIVRMALGASFKKIEEDSITDSKINKKRLQYFNRYKTVDKYW